MGNNWVHLVARDVKVTYRPIYTCIISTVYSLFFKFLVTFIGNFSSKLKSVAKLKQALQVI